MSGYLSDHLHVCLSGLLPVCLCVYVANFLCVCLAISLCVCVSVCYQLGDLALSSVSCAMRQINLIAL